LASFFQHERKALHGPTFHWEHRNKL
jgi:hypothetical protein